MKSDKLYIVGFMGCGKSSVGRELAKLLGWQFIDLDEFIESQQGISIAEMVQFYGMPYFRKLEALALQELTAKRAVVVGCGGGAFTFEANRDLMLGDGSVFWLYVPLPMCKERLSSEAEREKRPLMQLPDDELQALFDTREPLYGKAHIAVNGVASPQDVAHDIVRSLARAQS